MRRRWRDKEEFRAPFRTDDYSAIQHCKEGDVLASQELIARHQSEILRTAFLLTNRQQQTIGLAIAAFESTLSRLASIEDSAAFRLLLLESLVDAFLSTGQAKLEPELPIPAQSNSRFRVENDRSRVRQALQRLDPVDRVAVVLHIFNALPVESATTTDRNSANDRQQRLQQAKDRLQLSIDCSQNESLRGSLAEASIDAPQSSLWPQMEGELKAIRARERKRSHLITSVVAAGVLFILAAGLALTVSYNRADSGSAPSASSLAIRQSTRSNSIPVQSVLAPEHPRQASVPADLVASDRGRIVIFPPETSEQLISFDDSETSAISPDGKQFVAAQVVRLESALQVQIISFPTGSDGDGWEKRVVDVDDLINPESATFAIDIAISDTAVYAAYRAWQAPGPLTIVILDRITGEILHEYERPISGPITGQIRLEVQPDDSELYLFVDAQWQEHGNRIDYFRFSLPSMMIGQRTRPGGNSNSKFLSQNSDVLPDHTGLYRVTYGNDSSSVVIQFFDFDKGSLGEISLPFNPRHPEVTLTFETVASHDGRSLYVLAPTIGEVAIVDLVNRQLEQVVPLEMGSHAPRFPGPTLVSTPVWPGGQFMQLSVDGMKLYVTGVTFDRTFAVSDGVWVIDTREWRIVDHWFKGRPVEALALSGNRLYIQSEILPGDTLLKTLAPLPVSVIDTTTGESVPSTQRSLTWSMSITSLADLYRQQYGFSPVVGGAKPVDNRAYSTLPRLEIAIDPDTVYVGDTVTIDLRFIDPATGEPVKPGATTVRYQPPSELTLQLLSTSGKSLISIPAQIKPGHYRAELPLDGEGFWSLEILADVNLHAGGPTSLPDAITVLPDVRSLEYCALGLTDNDTARTPLRGECAFQ